MAARKKTRLTCAEAERVLAAHGMAYPEVTEAFPWGERALKVAGKGFAFLRGDEGFSIGVKLPASGKAALKQPFAEPTHYGLGKHGWVTANFKDGDAIPVDLLRAWIDESYRAIAPKRLIKGLAANLQTQAEKLEMKAGRR